MCKALLMQKKTNLFSSSVCNYPANCKVMSI